MKAITTRNIPCIFRNKPFVLVQGELIDIIKGIHNTYEVLYKDHKVYIEDKDLMGAYVLYRKEIEYENK